MTLTDLIRHLDNEISYLEKLGIQESSKNVSDVILPVKIEAK